MLIDYFGMVGPFIFPLSLLLLVIAALAVKNAFRMRGADPAYANQIRGSVDAILFWGGVAAVLGLLGQWTGLYRGIRAVTEEGLAPLCAEDPMRCFAMGFAESLTTAITGLTIFLVAGLLWFVLRSRVQRLTAA